MRWSKGKKTLHMGIKTIQTPLGLFLLSEIERGEESHIFSDKVIYKLSPSASKFLW